jgi:hypothetical protein
MAFVGRALSGLRFAGLVLGVAIVAAAGVGYWFFVSQQRHYIVGRDFRILSTLARQIDNAIQSEALVIKNLQNEKPFDDAGTMRATLVDRWLQLRGGPYRAADIQFKKAEGAEATAIAPRFEIDGANGPLVVRVPVLPGSEEANVVMARLELQPGLEALFTSRVGYGAFDAILLGTTEGRVLLSAGPSAQQIRSSGLVVLSSKTREGGTAVKFADLAKAITMADVSVAGVDYTVFVEPCSPSAQAGATGLVLVGLVKADTLRAGSWAIPTALVKLSVLSLLIALVGWPFLKLILLGDRQQVRVTDFFQLGASSVAGLAIMTVVLLDVSAYRRLNHDMDAQLRDLAHALDEHGTAEIGAAYGQLQRVEQAVAGLGVDLFKVGTIKSVLQRDGRSDLSGTVTSLVEKLNREPGSAQDDDVIRHLRGDERLSESAPGPWRYPFFETIAFMDQDGWQRIKLETSNSPSNMISVAEREYFKTIVNGRGWSGGHFCKDRDKCALESVWSRTTGEPLEVLAKTSPQNWSNENRRRLPVTAIAIPMRSLIGPVLPPGFAFAVIDHTGKVLFHSDRQRNGNEDFFVETDNNRRLRAQVAAHSSDALNINYWGAEYRAYVKPMNLPDMYVVAMAQKERAWAINREWLVVTLIFVSGYLLLWLIVALTTLAPGASWVWPDPRRRAGYIKVSVFCVALLAIASITAWSNHRTLLVVLGVALPLMGWVAAYMFLKSPPRSATATAREPIGVYSVATVLVLLVTGVIPGALLFLASYQLHAWSYIKSSQLILARRLSDRYDRLNGEYLNPVSGNRNPRALAAAHVGLIHDRDIYIDFLYNTSIRKASAREDDATNADHVTGHDATASSHDSAHHSDDMVLSWLEDYLPYYSEASVEWRELLHDRADDDSWESAYGGKGIRDVEVAFTSRTGSFPVELTSWLPSITHVPPTLAATSERAHVAEARSATKEPGPVPTTGSTEGTSAEPGTRDSWLLLSLSGVALLVLTGSVVQVLNRRVYLVGTSEPLWACDRLALNAGENTLVFCDAATKVEQLKGITPLELGPIVREDDFAAAWRSALAAIDNCSEDGAVVIADFDGGLDNARAMDRKLALLDELVSDQSRRVTVLSQVPLRGLTDSIRHSAAVMAAAARSAEPASSGTNEKTLDRWRRVIRAFVIVELRRLEWNPSDEISNPSTAVAFLLAERKSHPYVTRVCDDLLGSEAVREGRLTRRQTFDEVVERTAQFYRRLWTSCSEDEKVVLGHIAQHGLANASVRGVVRRLLGRGLLRKDPAFRPMNSTFRHFILTRECSQQVEALESENGPSAWDRLRAPLGIAVLGVGVFLFATQKELYNAIFGVATAAAASVPALIQTVGKLVGRPVEGPGVKA